jgi:hypothetical protein
MALFCIFDKFLNEDQYCYAYLEMSERNRGIEIQYREISEYFSLIREVVGETW